VQASCRAPHLTGDPTVVMLVLWPVASAQFLNRLRVSRGAAR